MFRELQEAVGAIEAVLADLEPGALSGEDARAMVQVFARGERLCSAGKSLCGLRVHQTFSPRLS
ncbi:MAG: hypothetical protein ACRD0L_12305, partial [Acidimicrobiales bacterium]